ncbi:hypothetical protein DFH29DRAFT_1074962 [Suillus ampliporus]|nr:hypothetical protein DFH29DRAFT_1074962 [Suillus ampliporus]
MISTNGAARHVTVTGYLVASFFKEVVLDHTSQVIHEAENITVGLVLSNLGLLLRFDIKGPTWSNTRASRLPRVTASRMHFSSMATTAMIGHLEQVYNEILVDQAALVEGWAAAMAELGLPSMLTPGPSLPNQKTTISGISAPEVPYDHIPKTHRSLLRCPLRPGATFPTRLKATASPAHFYAPSISAVRGPLRPNPDDVQTT